MRNTAQLQAAPLPFRWLVITLWLFISAHRAIAATPGLQFDVFFGYDGAIREGHWFPIAFEIKNDGPGFNAVIELAPNHFSGGGQTRRVPVELPNGTLKRIVIPMFSSSGRYGNWTARLFDASGRARTDALPVAPRRGGKNEHDLGHEAILLGALSRRIDELPAFPEMKSGRRDLAPIVARLDAAYFPDDPIALDGLNALYLNTAAAPGLAPPQAAALLRWLRAGGHLIVAVDQPGDANAVPWLKKILPCEFGNLVQQPMNGELQDWVLNITNAPVPAPKKPAPAAQGKTKTTARKNVPTYGSGTRLTADSAFENAELPFVEITHHSGVAPVKLGGKPLIVESRFGLGKISVLAFNPAREPFRSWTNYPWFWARLTGVSFARLTATTITNYGGNSVDAIFGALIDSRQVRKLPVSALVLLLAVYLAVIGPVDFISLRRLNRSVLTWVTFPAYVLLFSALIYWIGFALRAGRTEWNELHVVDVFPSGERAELRGRTFASIYSPSSAKYPVTADPACSHAAWRAEFMSASRGRQSSARMDIEQRGNSFRAQMTVPVWVSQLAACDWWRAAPAPLALEIASRGEAFDVTVENKLGRALSGARLVVRGQVFELGGLKPRETRKLTLEPGKGTGLAAFVNRHGAKFQEAMQFRGQAFGDERSGQLGSPSESAVTASFISLLEPRSDRAYNERLFLAPAGFDLAPSVSRGDAVLLAWDAGNSFISPLNGFTPKHGSRNTLLRLVAPVRQLPARPQE